MLKLLHTLYLKFISELVLLNQNIEAIDGRDFTLSK